MTTPGNPTSLNATRRGKSKDQPPKNSTDVKWLSPPWSESKFGPSALAVAMANCSDLRKRLCGPDEPDKNNPTDTYGPSLLKFLPTDEERKQIRAEILLKGKARKLKKELERQRDVLLVENLDLDLRMKKLTEERDMLVQQVAAAGPNLDIVPQDELKNRMEELMKEYRLSELLNMVKVKLEEHWKQSNLADFVPDGNLEKRVEKLKVDVLRMGQLNKQLEELKKERDRLRQRVAAANLNSDGKVKNPSRRQKEKKTVAKSSEATPKSQPASNNARYSQRYNPFARYVYLQLQHNRSPLEYRSPYMPASNLNSDGKDPSRCKKEKKTIAKSSEATSKSQTGSNNGRCSQRYNPFARYVYLQLQHNRSPFEYRSPYMPNGGFMNGYQGNLMKHLQHTAHALSKAANALSKDAKSEIPKTTEAPPIIPPAEWMVELAVSDAQYEVNNCAINRALVVCHELLKLNKDIAHSLSAHLVPHTESVGEKIPNEDKLRLHREFYKETLRKAHSSRMEELKELSRLIKFEDWSLAENSEVVMPSGKKVRYEKIGELRDLMRLLGFLFRSEAEAMLGAEGMAVLDAKDKLEQMGGAAS